MCRKDLERSPSAQPRDACRMPIAWAGSPMDPGFEKAVEEQAQKVNQEPRKEK